MATWRHRRAKPETRFHDFVRWMDSGTLLFMFTWSFDGFNTYDLGIIPFQFQRFLDPKGLLLPSLQQGLLHVFIWNHNDQQVSFIRSTGFPGPFFMLIAPPIPYPKNTKEYRAYFREARGLEIGIKGRTSWLYHVHKQQNFTALSLSWSLAWAQSSISQDRFWNIANWFCTALSSPAFPPSGCEQIKKNRLRK